MGDLRDDISKAFDTVEEKDEPTTAVSSDTDTADSIKSIEVKPAEESTLPSKEKDETEVAPTLGKKEGEVAPIVKDKPEVDTQVDTTTVKPPASWKPAAREHWAKIPNEARVEIQRREREIQQGLSQSAHARKFGDEFFKIMSPYEGLLRSQNATPLGAVNNLMQTVAGLSMGSVQQKATLVADIIKNYGIDIDTLSQLLAGQQPQKGDDVTERVMQRVNQVIAPIQQHLQGQTAQQRQQDELGQQAAINFVSEFISDTKNEFAEDLREDMADLMETAARRGKKLTIQQAYKLACDSDPQISQIIAQRKKAVSIVDKKSAASSLKSGAPNGTGSAVPADLRGVISAAFDKHAH